MSKLFVVCLVGLLLVSFVSVFSVVGAVTSIDSLPYTISSGGSYVLGANLTFASGVGITVSASNVVLDGNGHNIVYTGTATDHSEICVEIVGARSNVNVTNLDFVASGGKGVGLYNHYDGGVVHDVLVENCTFKGFYEGLWFGEGSYDWYVHRCYFSGCASHSLKAYGVGAPCYNFTFEDCESTDIGWTGFVAQDCHDFVVRGCWSHDSVGSGKVGFIFDGSNYNFVIVNCTSVNDEKGLYVLSNGVSTIVSNLYVREFRCVGATGAGGGIGFDNVTGVVFDYGYVSYNAFDDFVFSNDCFNVTVKKSYIGDCMFGAYGGGNSYGLTFLLNHFVSCSNNGLLLANSQVNVLYNTFTDCGGNSLGAGSVTNSSVVDLTVSKVGVGTVSPTVGVYEVDYSSWSKTASWSAGAGYVLDSVLFNGVSLGSVSPVSFEVEGDSSLVFTFESLPVEVTFTSTFTGGGFIIVNGTARSTPYVVASAVLGDVYNLTANTPVSLVTGVSRYTFVEWDYGVSSSSEDNPFMFTVPVGGDTVTAEYQLEYSVSTSCDDYSTISPLGVTWVVSGGSLEVTYDASGLYEISFCRVDGDLVDITGSYDFVNVVGSHSVSVGTSTPVPSGSASPVPSGGIGLGGVLYLGLDLPTIIILIVILMFVFLVVLPLAKRL